MGPLHMAVCAAVVVCGVAGAVFSARYHARRDAGQLTDAVFWDGFAGLVIVFPAVLIPSLASPWLGVAVRTLAACSPRALRAALGCRRARRPPRRGRVCVESPRHGLAGRPDPHGNRPG